MGCCKRYYIVILTLLLAVCGAARGQVVDTAIETAASDDFRVETTQVDGGAELITIFARSRALGQVSSDNSEIPLFTVLRDTLGDQNPENDRLRYVWMMTYTEPSFWQKVAGFVPFFYAHAGSKTDAGSKPPPAIGDVQRSRKALWNQIMWTAFRKIVLSEMGMGFKSPASQYHQNLQNYRRTAVASAMTLLSLYQNLEGESVLSDPELKDIQARLLLANEPLGWHMRDENLHRFYDKRVATQRDYRGHNWEMLRQYAEAAGLYFDPLEMPDGSAQHATLWLDAADLEKNAGRKFDPRFLNIKNPWTDQRLRAWTGYTQTRWLDDEDRVVSADTPNAKPHTMIPLAIYGLDHPKVPVILVDFRDAGNPHRREITKRILSDVTGNVLSLSQFGSIPFFLGRYVYEFVTGRRGMDVNQPSRMRSYAQLKMLLALDNSMDERFREETAKRIERVSVNPLENDLSAELKLARQQYKNLMDYAKRPDGLPAKLQSQRREEMVRLAHNDREQLLFRGLHYLSLGLYSHREDASADLLAKMDIRRQLDHHERFLREVAFRSADPEIDTNTDKLRASLRFVADHGTEAMDKTAKALGKIFAASSDESLRSLCLGGLYRINNSTAKNELLAIYDNKTVPDNWRVMSAKYLRRALDERQRMSKADAVAVAGIASN